MNDPEEFWYEEPQADGLDPMPFGSEPGHEIAPAQLGPQQAAERVALIPYQLSGLAPFVPLPSGSALAQPAAARTGVAPSGEQGPASNAGTLSSRAAVLAPA
jgi:hypothetical protein